MNLQRQLDVPDAEIHLWDVAVGTYLPFVHQLASMLAQDEIERAARYRLEHAKNSFIVTRAVMRILLSMYLGGSPENLRFSYGLKGKPALENESGLRFNISHSGNRALVAMAGSIEIGVDIEEVRPLDDMNDIARSFFCAEETRELMTLSPIERLAGFYRCWTRKESYLKCVGDGLTIPLDGFQVTLRSPDVARFIQIGGDPNLALQWTVADISVGTGYTAALAYRGPERQLRLRSAAEVLELSM